MTTDGGGWMVVFKNHGGAVGGELSNAALLEGDPLDYEGAIGPHTQSLESGINLAAWSYYRDKPDHEWLKIASLWDVSNNVVVEQTIRADFGAVTWAWILALPGEEACHVAPNPIAVVANAGVDLGQTDRVNSYQALGQTFGLASAHPGDGCGQPADNLITDPNQSLFRLDGGDTLNTIRHLFSYVHSAAGQNASRCQFACWDANNFDGHYDGFTWLVR